ncbi:hypothetical protein COCNU_09G004480 [Cocos nucifera]|uniref:Uncharacterized protein n=1 Tax=Cocos nucifera TaxID=13894 RepID=A0A8K0ILB1_COCNU|nr:hypothetical protein COCNU_09G004480 [Cocos nucifera]
MKGLLRKSFRWLKDRHAGGPHKERSYASRSIYWCSHHRRRIGRSWSRRKPARRNRAMV